MVVCYIGMTSQQEDLYGDQLASKQFYVSAVRNSNICRFYLEKALFFFLPVHHNLRQNRSGSQVTWGKRLPDVEVGLYLILVGS